jgi:hypothetical protein
MRPIRYQKLCKELAESAAVGNAQVLKGIEDA